MELTINAQNRQIVKKQVKSLRKQGLVPAAIFGIKGNKNIQLDEKEFTKVFIAGGHTSLVKIVVDGTTHNVLVDEVQMNPVTRNINHVSLREVDMNEEITAEIPFELVGEEVSPAVKEDNSLVILSIPQVLLRGLPNNLPSTITIDVSSMKAGDTVTLKEIKLPDGITVVHEEELEMTIVTTASAVQDEIEVNVNEAIAEANAAAEPKTEETKA